DPGLEPALLLIVADREPVLDQRDPGADEHPLELGARAEELLQLVLGAEAHHALDASSVVPTPVEQHDLARRRQVVDVALEVPLALLPLGWRAEGNHPAEARVQRLGDAFDGATLAGRIATLEDHDDLPLLDADELLELHELHLQPAQLLLEVLLLLLVLV